MTSIPSMDPSALASNRNDQKLESLQFQSLHNQNELSDERMKEIGDQFEAMMFRQLIKQMRKTVPDNGIIEKSHATGMFEDIADDHLAEHMAKTHNLGIDTLIVDELKQRQEQQKLMQQSGDEFKPLPQDESTSEFMPLNSEPDYIPLNNKPEMMELDQNENVFIPLSQHPGVSTSKIKND